MKPTSNPLWLTVLSPLLIFFTVGCEPAIISKDQETSRQFFLKDFKRSISVYTETEANQLISKRLLAESSKNAVVALVFDNKDKLLTPEEFNAIIASKNSRKQMALLTYLFTDLSSFKKVTESATAIADYTKALPNTEGTVAYVYDAYQSSYHTQEEDKKAIETMAQKLPDNLLPCEGCRVAAEPYFKATSGDIFINPSIAYDDSSESITGHAAICYLPVYYDTFRNYLKKVTVGEAQGYRNNDFDEVILQPLEVNWATHKNTMWRLVSFMDGHDNLLAMSNFVAANAVGSVTGVTFYNILAEKDGEIVGRNYNADVYEDFYCSLFAWQGYKDYSIENSYTGKMDIDRDNGYWCSPTDILLDTNPRHFFIKERFR